MDILLHHFYRMVMRAGEAEHYGRCFNLRLTELNPEQRSLFDPKMRPDVPTHHIVFRDTEHTRQYVGWLVEDSDERIIFSLGAGKEYEFRPDIIAE